MVRVTSLRALFVANWQRMGVGCAISRHSPIASTRRRRRREVSSGRTPGVRSARSIHPINELWQRCQLRQSLRAAKRGISSPHNPNKWGGGLGRTVLQQGTSDNLLTYNNRTSGGIDRRSGSLYMSVNHRVRSAVARALAVSAVAALGLTSFAANAQQAATSPTGPTASTSKKSQQLQTVIVTGSLISRTSIETPSPVQILSAAQMVQSGYTDFSSILKNISANGASTLSQSFSFAFAAGASGVSLRGLSVGDTLVLIDGERTVPYPLLDDNQRSFVDLASIPFTAIQSVQIDKNGASGVYGSDAIAGVVNVILRKEYQGFKVSAETGTSQRGDGTMEHIGFIGGHGSLAEDGYNWYVSGDFRHQDQILARNRHGLWDNIDYTPFGGTFGGANNVGQAAALDPIFAYPQSGTGYFINPATGSIVNYLPGCDTQSQALNKCLTIDPNAQLQPSTTRVDLLGKFTKQLSDNWTLGIQASWFESSSQEKTGYSG
ncbi:MAG: TonB-dependent receptor plug domain-containing protein, partial [Gallionella sp.]|nr:TonB-dependent receptor plug domain-containing protein [Gallionella sp.]